MLNCKTEKVGEKRKKETRQEVTIRNRKGTNKKLPESLLEYPFLGVKQEQ